MNSRAQGSFPLPAWDTLTLTIPAQNQEEIQEIYRSPDGFVWGYSQNYIFRMSGSVVSWISKPHHLRVNGLSSPGFSQLLISSIDSAFTWNGSAHRLENTGIPPGRFRTFEGLDGKSWLADSLGLYPYQGGQGYFLPQIPITQVHHFTQSMINAPLILFSMGNQISVVHSLLPGAFRTFKLKGEIRYMMPMAQGKTAIVTTQGFYTMDDSVRLTFHRQKSFDQPIPFRTRIASGWIFHPRKSFVICNPKGETVQEIPSYIPFPTIRTLTYLDAWGDTWICRGLKIFRLSGGYSFFYPRNIKPPAPEKRNAGSGVSLSYHSTYHGPKLSQFNTYCLDRFGHTWFASDLGLWMSLKETGEIILHVPIPGGAKNIKPDAKGNIWGYGNQGVFLYQQIVQRLTFFHTQSGIPIAFLAGIHVDSLGILLYTKEQVFRLFQKTIKFYPQGQPCLMTGITLNGKRISETYPIPPIHSGKSNTLRFSLTGPGRIRSIEYKFIGQEHEVRDQQWQRSEDGWIYIPTALPANTQLEIRYRDWFGFWHTFRPPMENVDVNSNGMSWAVPWILLFTTITWMLMIPPKRIKSLS